MKKLILLLALSSLVGAEVPAYQKAGLNSYQAAAHLLSRFTYGARPGEVEKVAAEGIEGWLERQLSLQSDDCICREQLQAYPALAMEQGEIQTTYLSGPELRRLAVETGLLDKKSAAKEDRQAALRALSRQGGLQTERDLLRQLAAQKVVRASLSEHQLQEVMTDFWFNHFNVSRTTAPVRPYLLSYERDVIRPGSLGSFRQLLGATSCHPAMLLYLNNAQSMAELESRSRMAPRLPGRKMTGLNENYARELLELHTLGVDGGYTQKDVTEVARIFTGWTVMPRGPQAERYRRIVERHPQGVETLAHGALFVPFLHDIRSKVVRGTSYSSDANNGMQEAARLLDSLAADPATARRIARKLAVRFVADEPDPKLVEQLAGVYRSSGGDSAAMLRWLVRSPGFWSAQALRSKVKSPLEYCISSLRAVQAEVGRESQLPLWIERMGQAMYGCVPPTGYPDKGEQWLSSGTLVTRINFAFALTTQRIQGISVPPQRGTLEQLAAQMLPGRPVDELLVPVRSTLSNEGFFKTLRPDLPEEESASEMDGETMASQARPRPRAARSLQAAPVELTEMQKQLGVLLSCPEFQRR